MPQTLLCYAPLFNYWYSDSLRISKWLLITHLCKDCVSQNPNEARTDAYLISSTHSIRHRYLCVTVCAAHNSHCVFQFTYSGQRLLWSNSCIFSWEYCSIVHSDPFGSSGVRSSIKWAFRRYKIISCYADRLFRRCRIASVLTQWYKHSECECFPLSITAINVKQEDRQKRGCSSLQSKFWGIAWSSL